MAISIKKLDAAVVCERLALRHSESPIDQVKTAVFRNRQVVGKRDGCSHYARRYTFYRFRFGKQRADIRFCFHRPFKPHQLQIYAGQAGFQIALADIKV